MALSLKDLSKVDNAYVPLGGRYIMALDSGTTSVRAVIVDEYDCVVAQASRHIKTMYPRSGWVEQDPMEILASQIAVMMEVQFKSGIHSDRIAAIGITNQRETTVVWDRDSGQPIHNAIVWQCRRTADISDRLVAEGMGETIRRKTGLMPDPYFSGTKIRWIIDNVDGARAAADAGELMFGTIDTWLIYNLTGGAVHATDYTNASRTMLFNIHTLEWDDELLKMLDIPRSMLPEVRWSSDDYGSVSNEIMTYGPPITGVAGDQQASLFGHCCFTPGCTKNTYGTGCFMLMNTGETCVTSEHGLVSTIGIAQGGKISYALEGSIFHAGATIQWLRDKLGLISSAKEASDLCRHLDSNGGCYLVPACLLYTSLPVLAASASIPRTPPCVLPTCPRTPWSSPRSSAPRSRTARSACRCCAPACTRWSWKSSRLSWAQSVPRRSATATARRRSARTTCRRTA